MAIAARPSPSPRRRDEDENEKLYPSSDGKPMAETDQHAELMIYFKEALRHHYADRPDVYVSGNNFIYYEEGNPKARISPDCYVVFGAGMRLRNSFMTWREGNLLPAVVFEFTSRSTRREDTHTKRPLYESALRVPEYFLFDPTGDYLRPRLQGFRLGAEGRYVALEAADGRLHSEQLNLDLVPEGTTLRLFDPARGEFLPTMAELAQRAEAEARRAEVEAQRADVLAQRIQTETEARRAAEEEVARLRAELEALRGQP